VINNKSGAPSFPRFLQGTQKFQDGPGLYFFLSSSSANPLSPLVSPAPMRASPAEHHSLAPARARRESTTVKQTLQITLFAINMSPKDSVATFLLTT
jgi:hypothetical protein